MLLKHLIWLWLTACGISQQTDAVLRSAMVSWTPEDQDAIAAESLLATAAYKPSRNLLQGSCDPESYLGYQCRRIESWGTLHYSINTTWPPSNICTGSDLTEVDRSQGLIHFAVEMPVTGWVALGFTESTSMGSISKPSYAVLGYASDTALSVKTYTITSTSGVGSGSNPSTWASNLGVTQDGDKTIICFSRTFQDPIPLNLTSFKFNWAYHATEDSDTAKHTQKGQRTMMLLTRTNEPQAPAPNSPPSVPLPMMNDGQLDDGAQSGQQGSPPPGAAVAVTCWLHLIYLMAAVALALTSL